MTARYSDAADASALRARVDDGSVAYWRTLGIVVERVDGPGHAVLSLAMREALGTRRPEVMHGGAIASLIDAAAGAAVITLREEGDDTWSGQASLDLNVTFLNAATTAIVAEAKVLKHSRSLAFVSVDVRDDTGELVSVGRVTYSIMRRQR
ncbi:MAG: PaaI family thioesterase [Dehalococcoidia bacterium]|nr:PaaI family thioesterase [Dehalococcoidia bacterium]